MSSPVGESTLRHLVYCKALYLHAIEHCNSESVLDRAVSILNLDSVVEMLLSSMLDQLGGKPPPERFEAILDAFKKRVGVVHPGFDLSILHEVDVWNLHRARNEVQHHGIVPGRDDVERYRSLVQRVVSDLLMGVLKIDFMEISLGELIRDEATRVLFKRAENAFTKADYGEALVCAAAAFERAKKNEQGRIYGSLLLPTLLLSEFKKEARDLDNKLIEELEVLKLRLDYKKYQKYRELFGLSLEPFQTLLGDSPQDILNYVKTLTANSSSRWEQANENRLREDTVFCLNFVVESVLRWESVSRLGWIP